MVCRDEAVFDAGHHSQDLHGDGSPGKHAFKGALPPCHLPPAIFHKVSSRALFFSSHRCAVECSNQFCKYAGLEYLLTSRRRPGSWWCTTALVVQAIRDATAKAAYVLPMRVGKTAPSIAAIARHESSGSLLTECARKHGQLHAVPSSRFWSKPIV